MYRREKSMARPKPNIMLEIVDKNYNTEQILDAEAIYAVYHNKKPINLRTMNTLVNYPGPKYKKVSFSNSGHAFNLADRLNKKFNTESFEVVRLLEGETINRDHSDSK
tara:strand:- start:842 stop:1165 length:324 start_codon:yes stop_codon:yes gene_type:complete